MREYKKLQKIADESLEQYNNTEFLEEMKRKIEDNADSTERVENKRRSLFFTACATVVSAAMIICSIFLILPQNNVVIEEKHYTQDHEETGTIDLAALNSGLTNIRLENGNYEDIKKCYDTFYGDILYYKAKLIINEFEDISIRIISNKDYEYFVDYECDKTDAVCGYGLQYKEEYQDASGLYRCKVYGYMDTGAEKIYFTYNAYTIDQSSNFVNAVKDIIKQK